MIEPTEVPPGLRAMTDRLMAECSELLPRNVNKIRETQHGGLSKAEIFERFVMEGALTVTDLSQPLTLLCTSFFRIIELEDELKALRDKGSA